MVEQWHRFQICNLQSANGGLGTVGITVNFPPLPSPSLMPDGAASIPNLVVLGDVLWELGDLAGAYDHEDALVTARDALAKATRLAMSRTQASARHVLGTVMVELGRVDEARIELESALNLSTEASHPRGRGHAACRHGAERADAVLTSLPPGRR